MNFSQVQMCISNQPWYSIKVRSDTNPRLVYSLKIPLPDDPKEEIICQCQGYIHRGACKHQGIADMMRCGWQEGDPESQIEPGYCPRCGNQTYTETVIK